MLYYVPPLIIPQLAEPRGLPGDRCLVPLPSTKSNPVLIQSTRLVLWFIATGINQAQGLSTWPEGGAALARRWCWSTLATQKLKAPPWESNKAIFFSTMTFMLYKESVAFFRSNLVLRPMNCDVFPTLLSYIYDTQLWYPLGNIWLCLR